MLTKILRHGYESVNPFTHTPNWATLELHSHVDKGWGFV